MGLIKIGLCAVAVAAGACAVSAVDWRFDSSGRNVPEPGVGTAEVSLCEVASVAVNQEEESTFTAWWVDSLLFKLDTTMRAGLLFLVK